MLMLDVFFKEQKLQKCIQKMPDDYFWGGLWTSGDIIVIR